MLTLKVLGALLAYPEAETMEALGEMEAALCREKLLSRGNLDKVEATIAAMRAEELLEVQARYVQLFDRTRSLSLHLFEHVHGDSRARGPALVELGKLYASHGLDPIEGELPDYLPLYLEFLSLLPPSEARRRLGDVAHILEALAVRLRERDSVYAGLFEALVALAATAEGEALPLLTEDEPETAEAMDKAWEEAAVVFGPEAAPQAQGGCTRTAAMLSRLQQRN